MKKKVVVLAKFLGRDSGGVSSIMDLIEGFVSLGNEVYVGLDQQTPNHYNQNVRKVYPLNLKETNIFRIPEELRISSIGVWKQYMANIKAIKKDPRNFFFKLFVFFYRMVFGFPNLYFGRLSEKKTELKGWEWIKNADVIIYATFLKPQAIDEIKKKSKAIIVRNHAGAKQLMSFWIKHYSKMNPSANETLYVSYLKRFDKVLFQSQEQANDFESSSKVLNGKAIVIPPTCDEKAIENAKKLKNPYLKGTLNIAVVGSIQERKGQDIAIHVFEKLASSYQNLHIHFIGHINPESNYCHDFLHQIKNSKFHEKIHFHGHRKDYLRYMVNSDILLQPSKQEGVSRILRETMFMKVPIVAFNISGTRDLLEANEEALLISPFNLEELRRSIESLLIDPKKGPQISQNALKIYQRNNSKEAYLNAIAANFNF